MGGREHKEVYTWDPSDSPHISSPYHLAVYPYYTVRNLRCKYNYRLNSVSSSSECSNIGVVLGIPDTVSLSKQFL